ncbi:unnamed protein product, partial [marine sediment metagenome]
MTSKNSSESTKPIKWIQERADRELYEWDMSLTGPVIKIEVKITSS